MNDVDGPDAMPCPEESWDISLRPLPSFHLFSIDQRYLNINRALPYEHMLLMPMQEGQMFFPNPSELHSLFKAKNTQRR